MPSAGLILLSFNLLLVIAILLGFLGGVIKGLYKSVIYLGFSIVFFVVGVLLIPFLSEAALDWGFLGSLLAQAVPDAGVEASTIRIMLPDILAHLLPEQADLFVAGSETMAVVYGVVKLALSLALLIVLLVLNATIFKLFPFILWLIIKPRKSNHPLDYGRKPKKHRLLGGLVGAVKGFMALFLVAIPAAGLASIAREAAPLYETIQEGGGIPSGNASDIFTLADSDEEDAVAQSLAMFKGYDNSIIGNVFGLGGMDEKLFDGFFKIDVKTEDGSQKIQLRKDIVKAINIAEIALEANDNSLEFDMSYIFKITEEDLRAIQTELEGITILNILKNIGAEYGYDFLEKENLTEGYEDDINLAALKAVDINREIDTLIEVVIIFANSENKDEIVDNFLVITKEEADAAFEELGKLQLVRLGLPVVVNYILNMPETIQAMEDNGLDPDDLTRPTIDELLLDFKNIVNIYDLAKDMGFNNTSDFENINEEFVVAIEDVHIEELFEVVFDFSFLYKNDKLFANLAYDFVTKSLPAEYLDIINRETLVDNFNAGELASIAKVGKLLYGEKLFKENETIDYENVLREENVNKLSKYISESMLLTEGMEGVANLFLKDLEYEGQAITLVMPTSDNFRGEVGEAEIKALLLSVRNMFEIGILEEGFDFKNVPNEKIDEIATNFSSSLTFRENLAPLVVQFTETTEFAFVKDSLEDVTESYWTKTEIKALMLSAKNIVELGLLEEGFDFATVSDEKLTEISTNFNASLTIRRTLSPMINYLTETTEYAFITSDEDESFWTQKEIYYTLNAVKIFASEEISETTLHTIEDAKVLEISKSMTVSNAFGKFLVEENKKDGLLDEKLHIPEGLIYYTTEEKTGELYYFFVGVKEIFGEDDLADFAIEMEDVSNMDIELIFESKVLEATVVENHLKEMHSETIFGKYIIDKYENEDEFDWYVDENPANPKGDSIPLVLALTGLDALGITYGTMNYSSFVLVLQTNPTAAQEINDLVISSAILNASLPKMINELINNQAELDIKVYPDYNKKDLAYWGTEGENKELYYILDALTVADYLKDFDYIDLNNSNKEEFKANSKKIAKSETLRQMLPKIFVESNLTIVKDYESDVNPYSLTEADWNNEIDVLVEILVKINEKPTINFEDPDPADFDVVTDVMLLMANSMLYDVVIVENELKDLYLTSNLGDYMVDTYENGSEFDWHIGKNPNNYNGDLIPLINAIGELNNLGITYTTMNYANFINVLKTNPTFSQQLNDAILSSVILNASLPKMFNKLLNTEGGLNVVVYPNYNKEDLAYWGTETENKELYYIFDALVAADDLKAYDYETLDNSNKEDFKDNSKKIAKSETLRQILPRIIIDSNLTMANSLRSEVDPNTLTELEWNNEIDVLVEIIVILNENPTLDVDNPNPADIPVVLEIRLLMVDSLLYDESKIIL
jgi:hypothetical protein